MRKFRALTLVLGVLSIHSVPVWFAPTNRILIFNNKFESRWLPAVRARLIYLFVRLRIYFILFIYLILILNDLFSFGKHK